MYKKDFDNLIKKKSYPKSLLIYGDEFYTNYYIQHLLKVITIKENILSFYFDEYNFESAKNFISQPSLFGDINLLYIKSDKKLPTNEVKELINICSNNPLSYFYYEFLGDDSKIKSIANLFTSNKSAVNVRFFKPTLSEAIAILRKKADKLNLKISNHLLKELYELENENLSFAINDLNKLSLFDKEITSKDINKHIFGMGEVVLDEFIYKLLSKQEFAQELHHIFESIEIDAIKIVNSIQNYISTLLMFHLYIKSYRKYDTKEILGYIPPTNFINQRVELSTKIDTNKYEKLFKLLLDSEFNLKNKKNIDKNRFLYATFIKLQRIL